MDFTGTTARESFVGTIDPDEFDMSQGGRDTVSGLEGDDVFIFGGELNANDQIDGGADHDTLVLEGNYVGGVVFGPATMVNVETILLLPGFSYALTLDAATASPPAIGDPFHVDAGQLGAADSLVFDGTAETGVFLEITGGAGDDVLTGSSALLATFNLGMGGDDLADASGSGGAFHMGGALDAGDTLIGGPGYDNAYLEGDYSAGLTITGAMLVGVESVNLSAQFAAALVLADDLWTASHNHHVNVIDGGGAPATGISVDASAETDTAITFNGADGSETFTGGALGDTFDLDNPFDNGGADVIAGGAGDDLIMFGDSFTRDDQADGGDGHDVLRLDFNLALTVNYRSTTMVDVEEMDLSPGLYDLTLGNNNIRGEGFLVDAADLASINSLAFDAGAESSTAITILAGASDDTLVTGGGDDSLDGADGADSLTAGAGDDTLDGGAGLDTLAGGLGTDRMHGGARADTFVYTGFAESTGPGRDWLDVLQPLRDQLDLDVGVAAVAPRINAGALSEATFESDLSTAVASLPAGQAVVFKPNSGDLAGHFFLVVDADGLFGYTPGQDYVFEFAAGSNPNAIAVGFFI